MTATAGFQYTPPSYLVRAMDSTNRPWSKTEEGEGDHENTGDNEYDLPQEDRPQTKRESHLDAHFQQRVRNKQSRYRDILTGDATPVETPVDAAPDEDEDSILATARNVDSFAEIHSAKLQIQSASTNQQARKIRKERIKGVPSSPIRSSSSASNAENARSLRAHRLRNSLLKKTPDEFDVQDKLEMRRLARKSEEAAARRAERDAKANDPTFQDDTISNTKDLDKKRLSYEAEREAFALAKEEAAEALLRAAELNEERIRQRDRNSRREDYREEEERAARRERGHKKASKKTIKKNRYSMRTKKYEDDNDTLTTEFDAENDFAFLNDISGIVRDSGILKSCGSCFGEIADEEETFLKTKCAQISSVFVPDLAPSSDTSASDVDGDATADDDSKSIRRSREYARYRE